jgi:hypothetical protein
MNYRYFWKGVEADSMDWRLYEILANPKCGMEDGFKTEEEAVAAFKRADEEYPHWCPRELELIKVYSTYRWEE